MYNYIKYANQGLKKQLFGKGNNSFAFNLAKKLPSGLYFLKVDSNEFSETLKNYHLIN